MTVPVELNLTFPDAGHVQVSLRYGDRTEGSPAQTFVSPLDQKTREELTWYLETYAAQYMTDLDDTRAAGIAARLKDHGGALFNAAFSHHTARRLFDRFQDNDDPARQVTISSLHPAVLAQPWELLCDPDGTFLCLEPGISIRRTLSGTGRKPYRPEPKDTLNLLFVVSRPNEL